MCKTTTTTKKLTKKEALEYIKTKLGEKTDGATFKWRKKKGESYLEVTLPKGIVNVFKTDSGLYYYEFFKAYRAPDEVWTSEFDDVVKRIVKRYV
jgi:hypothetical protein